MRTTIGVSLCLLLLAACGDPAARTEETSPQLTVAGRGAAFVPPSGTVAVSFSVDDRANRVYRDGDLKWKGSFLLDPATRLLSFDPGWTGGGDRSGWPTLHDDGPWTRGGHEPIGARAGDHVWGITVFVAPPSEGVLAFEYGLVDESYEARLGSGWIWKGPNGAFSVAAGASGAIDAAGMVIPRFGWNDLVLRLDATQLSASHDPLTWDASTGTVKSSAWGWSEIPLTSLGHGQYGFLLSPHVGPGRLLPHTGLLGPGEVAEFVFVLGTQYGPVEYKDWTCDDSGCWNTGALTGGVSAGTFSWCNLRYSPAAVEVLADGNTAVTAPTARCGWSW
jgi:hypothetical protein